MTKGVDSGEKTLHTTSSNESKFSQESKVGGGRGGGTIAEKTSLTITSFFRKR